MATSHTADSSPTGLPRGCGWMLGKFIHHGGFSCGAANGEPVSSAGRIHHVKHSIPADDLISKCTTLKTRGFRVFKYIYYIYYEIRTKVI